MARKSEAEQRLASAGVTIVEDQPDIQTVAESDLGRVAAEEAFMNQMLDLIIFPTTDPQAPPYAQIGVNGTMAYIPRGVPVPVRRKHVEVMARLKTTSVTQDMKPNAEGEITMASLRGHTGLVYPFNVIRDPDPRGGTWLAQILAEPA
jgi:hypothetical protein